MTDQRKLERRPVRAWYEQLGQQVQVDGDDERQWPLWTMILGIFVTVLSFWFVSARTFVTYWDLGRALFVLMFVGNLIPGIGARLKMDRRFWAMFNMLGAGPLVFSALLWTNFTFTSGHHGYIVVQPDPGMDPRRYWVEHDHLPEGFAFDLEERMFEHAERIRPGDWYLVTSRGCLGYEVVRSYTMITPWSGNPPGASDQRSN